MNLDSLPLPKIDRSFHPSHFTTIARVIGVILVVQWILPWGSGPAGGVAMSWDLMGGLPGAAAVVMPGAGNGFAIIWALLAGIALAVIGFAPIPKLKPGVRLAIAGGIGLIGLISIAAGPDWLWSGFFGLFGLTTAAFALFYWARNGYSQLTLIMGWAGVGLMGLALLIPIHGEVPIISIFKIFGADGIFILARIFVFLFSLVFIGLAVLTVLFVLLRGESADPKMVRLLANAHVIFLPVAWLVIGLFGMFTAGALLGARFHIALIATSYIFLTLYAAVQLLEAQQRQRLGQMF